MNLDRVLLAYHSTFYAVAHTHLQRVRDLQAAMHERYGQVDGAGMTDEEVDFVAAQNAAIQREAMVVVVFSPDYASHGKLRELKRAS